MHVYDAVTTKAGRYVQGGGCTTVGVAGLVQSGGFGSFSKNFGTAAASLLEAEIVTADGAVRIVNACSDPELFWGIKGGGGGSLGVVTRADTENARPAGLVRRRIRHDRGGSDAAFRRLVGGFVDLYRNRLFNPYWGESVEFRHGNILAISMVSQSLDRQQAEDVWRPFLDWVARVTARAGAGPGADHRQHPGAAVVGRGVSATVSTGFGEVRRQTGSAGRQYVVDGRRRSGRLVPSWLRVRMAARIAATASRRASPMRCSPPAGIGASGCISTRALPADSSPRRRRTRETATNPAVLDAFALAIIGGCRTVRVCRHTRPCRGTPRRTCGRCGDGGTAQGGARCRRLRVGEQLLPVRLATRLLGRRTIRGCAR